MGILLSEKIKFLRKKRGKKLREIAAGTGLSVSYVSDIECGRTMPSVTTLQKIANYYNNTLSWLVAGVEVDGLTTACTTDTDTPCPFCDGAGWAYYTGDSREDCHVCNGTGKA